MNDDQQFWNYISRILREGNELTAEEAALLYEQADDGTPLTAGEIERIVGRVTSGARVTADFGTDFSHILEADHELSEEVALMNRNAGDFDDQARDRLAKLRREAFVDEDDENELPRD